MNVVIKNGRILDAAAQVLAKRPDATLQSIAQAAGISRTTIFNRYPTREDLLEALAVDALQRVEQVLERTLAGDEDDVEAVLLNVTRGLMPLGPHSLFLRSVPGQDNDLDTHWAQAVMPLGIYFAAAQSRGQLRMDLPTRWLVSSYLSLLFGAWDEVAAGELGPVQAARLTVDTWLTGSARRPTGRRSSRGRRPPG